jgi:tellurite resistance protein TerC
VENRTWLWIGFNAFVLAMLAIDLGLVRRKSSTVSPKEATIWTLVWISLSLAFCGWIWKQWGAQKGLEFLTGYVIEYSLSVDNLFVFLLLFRYFRVKPEDQHPLLFWGVMGAFVMRAALILVGAALVAKFDWLLYLFGGFLVWTAVKMLFSGEGEVDPEHNPVLKFARKHLRVSRSHQPGARFFIREGGKLLVTPMFLVLLMIESTDLLFALDSIPAVLGVSKDPFILYTSNVCAILGLRSLFFVVASLMDKFHYLKVGLAVVLGFVGVKMLLEPSFSIAGVTWKGFHVPIPVSLGVIAGVLAASILASLLRPARPELPPPPSDLAPKA